MTSGRPTEAELWTQWQNAVRVLNEVERSANLLCSEGKPFDVLAKSLEGTYTPDGLANWSGRMRAALSETVDPAFAFDMLAPIILEYGAVLVDADAFGSGYESVPLLKDAIYEHFHAQGLTVQSRALVLDQTPSKPPGNVGQGAMARLVVDENDYPIEAVHVERKKFRCRRDANTGTRKNAEEFECIGEARSRDNLQFSRPENGTTFDRYGSGTDQSAIVTNSHAGTGAGGSALRNSSFDDYDGSATPRFAGWTQVSGAVPTQDTTNFYNTNPTATTDGALSADGAFKIAQPLADMRIARFDVNTPYAARIMVNAALGSATGGSIEIKLGKSTKSETITNLVTAGGWVEIIITFDKDVWPRTFNETDLEFSIEWAGATGGSVLIDDAIVAPMTLIDGTWWFLRQGAAAPVAWLVDDLIEFDDEQGVGNNAEQTGLINYWLFRAGLGYLPASLTPDLTDPPALP